MVVVIADAGPLIGLAKIQQLDLLKDLFANVLITRAVAEECLRCSSLDAVLIQQAIDAGWLQRIADPVLQHGLSKSLGLDEQTSIEQKFFNFLKRVFHPNSGGASGRIDLLNIKSGGNHSQLAND